MPCWVQDGASFGPNVWLLCERSEILYTPDAGKSWQTLKVPSESQLKAIAFADAKRGFVAGRGGLLVGTADGGKTWQTVDLGVDLTLTSLYFRGDLGWVAGYGGLIFHTSDGGKTWKRQEVPATTAINSIYFVDDKHGWAVGWVGLILRTTDGGASWEQIKSPAAEWTLTLVRFRDSLNGWIVGPFGQILRSKDGGASWTKLESPVGSWLTSIRFDNTGRGWITAEKGLLTSEDGGETWKAVNLEGWMFLERLLPVGDTLWAVGPFGIIRQDPAKGGNWTELDAIRKPG